MSARRKDHARTAEPSPTRARSAPRRAPAGQVQSVNPATGETLATFDLLSATEVARRIERAAEAFREHRRMPFAERTRRMLRVADILEEQRDEYARLMTLEMGKPI